MKNQPLYLAKGSIRAILILILTIAIIYFLWQNIEVKESIITLWATAFGWYFGGRSNNK